ncbi:imidazole glycerol phosphate synthase subunit HisH [Shewanella sp. NIFS-20-20]|uniref:imidazole glycerol phosphate synthase subunit HisH n=1 Tax=Shewanella sp. NIFS-20-20 TaxID=2853806 RepID=UPI001C453472|nr:imidazole glycerol phosphate synthase subunit HisH [Shewanella sp. NIFS-20-20]MBV7314399.1 imidazole glycerol phosphate synthase subunit HisH [Shewanella sp. NIFS-20-20]
MNRHSPTDTTVIIDTGCANLNSVKFACERVLAKRLDVAERRLLISADPEQIRAATRVILPGVGTARAAMRQLAHSQLLNVIPTLSQPVLGICLGMQLLCQYSSEGDIACLGLIPSRIEPLTAEGLPVPHMGWDQLTVSDHPLFNDIESGSYVYFVHSFAAPLSSYTLASCHYGEDFSAAIGRDNFMGVQFHPEKSADVGERILRNFMEMQA